jgi:cytochrome c nitrite reductase small subunit
MPAADDTRRPEAAPKERRAARLAALLPTIAAVLGVTIGAAAGVGGYVFVYAEGASYLTDDPDACANCHVMRTHLDAWSKSSHRAVAVCNDCHAPPGLLGKYTVKAINGWNHSLAFVTGRFKDPFHITPMNKRVTEAACRECHGEIVAAIDHSAGEATEPLACVRCHAHVGHHVQ